MVDKKDSLYGPALEAFGAGKITSPERRPTLRPEETYLNDENIIEQAERKQSEILARLDEQEAEQAGLREEIRRLREQVDLAHGILASEPMIWLVLGSNHPEAQWDAIKPAIDTYWEEHGNTFHPKARRKGAEHV